LVGRWLCDTISPVRRSLLVLFLCLAPRAASADPPDLSARLDAWFRGRLRSDPAMVAAAEDNSRALAELSGGEQLGVTDYLQFLLERHQVRDAVVLALSGRFADAERLWQRLRAYLEEHAAGGELTHYGFGLTPTRRGLAATLILVRRGVELLSLRAVPGRRLELCGSTRHRGELRVLATTPRGRVIEARPQRRSGRFCAGLGQAERGRYQLELMVDGPFGPEVTALFPLFVGEAPPALPVQKIYPATTLDPAAAEEAVLALLQRARREAGLPPLAPAAELRRAARRHSDEMLRRGFFGHRSPARGGLARRLADEQLPYVQASENLVLSTSPQRAHDALLASPAHRRNLLDPALTHVGIGVAVSPARGLLYITQCFTR
jgi:uncharacterized protein YkwD